MSGCIRLSMQFWGCRRASEGRNGGGKSRHPVFRPLRIDAVGACAAHALALGGLVPGAVESARVHASVRRYVRVRVGTRVSCAPVSTRGPSPGSGRTSNVPVPSGGGRRRDRVIPPQGVGGAAGGVDGGSEVRGCGAWSGRVCLGRPESGTGSCANRESTPGAANRVRGRAAEGAGPTRRVRAVPSGPGGRSGRTEWRNGREAVARSTTSTPAPRAR